MYKWVFEFLSKISTLTHQINNWTYFQQSSTIFIHIFFNSIRNKTKNDFIPLNHFYFGMNAQRIVFPNVKNKLFYFPTDWLQMRNFNALVKRIVVEFVERRLCLIQHNTDETNCVCEKCATVRSKSVHYTARNMPKSR